MFKRVCITVIILIMSLALCGAADNDIQFYQHGKLLGSMTKAQFTTLLAAADNALIYNEELLIEKNNKVKVNVINAVYDDTTQIFTYSFEIVWVSDSGTIIKQLALSSSTTIPKDGVFYSKFRVWYRDCAEIVAPAGCALSILLLLILL